MIDGIDVAPQPWTGRSDGVGTGHARWHTVLRAADDPTSGVNLVGFCSDEGVRRNGGRVGAASGPAELRRALANLAEPPALVADCGDVIVRGQDLEGAQERLGLAVGAVLAARGLPVVLGGGHEVAYGSYQGWRRRLDAGTPERWGVLNLDAHLDLRHADHSTSGSPFLQMAVDETMNGRDFDYAVLGVNQAANTRILFDRAAELGVRFLYDELCEPEAVAEFVAEFLARVDRVHLSVDLDVLPSYVAPGVSAPAALGVPLAEVRTAVRMVAESGKLGLLEVAELNPALDVDARTARTAAYLLDDAVRRHA